MSTSDEAPLAEPVVVGVDGSASSLVAIDPRGASPRRLPVAVVPYTAPAG
jgi:hypothetical protein